MRLKIEFDSIDLANMLTSFFNEAGYSINAESLHETRVQFEKLFPTGLELEVTPKENDVRTSVVADEPVAVAPEVLPLKASEVQDAPEPQETSEPILSWAQIKDGTHSEDDEAIQALIATSRRLERG